MADRKDEMLEAMRSRVLRGMQSGTLVSGDRLPSARALEREMGVDHRVFLDIYRQLAAEGLVETRQRGGVYVAQRASAAGIPALPQAWLVDVLMQSLSREIPVPDLHEWLRRSTETLRLRAAVIATTTDQSAGLCRELRDDFGLESESVALDQLPVRPVAAALRRADLLISTAAHKKRVERFAQELGKSAIIVDVRPDLISGEWRLLLQRPVYAIVGSRAFGKMLRDFLAKTPGAKNLRTLVVGVDDLATIPPDAATYITQQARQLLGDQPLPGKLIPAARTIAPGSARAILEFIVKSNHDAMIRLER